MRLRSSLSITARLRLARSVCGTSNHRTSQLATSAARPCSACVREAMTSATDAIWHRSAQVAPRGGAEDAPRTHRQREVGVGRQRLRPPSGRTEGSRPRQTRHCTERAVGRSPCKAGRPRACHRGKEAVVMGYCGPQPYSAACACAGEVRGKGPSAERQCEGASGGASRRGGTHALRSASRLSLGSALLAVGRPESDTIFRRRW